MGEIRTNLAQFVHDQARLRESKLDESDVDRRSQRSAERLRQLAAYVETLPDEDPRLEALSRVHAERGHDAFVVGDDARYLVSRFAFDAADAAQGFDEFLTKVVTVLVAADRREQLDELEAQLESEAVDGLLDELGEDER